MMRRLCFALFAALSVSAWSQNPVELNKKFESLSSQEQILFKDLANELRCPTCTGLSVLQSETPFSMQIKSTVIHQIREGKSHEAILTFFKERYGLWILRTPPVEGFHWIAWILPLGLAAIGIVLLWMKALRSQRRPLSQGIRPMDEIVKEWEAELNSMRRSQ